MSSVTRPARRPRVEPIHPNGALPDMLDDIMLPVTADAPIPRATAINGAILLVLLTDGRRAEEEAADGMFGAGQ